jgi:hypothetical protein
MRCFRLSAAALPFLCLLAAGPVQGQEKDGMHRLEIYNSGRRTVQYYGNDAAAARDRGRRENDAVLADLAYDLRVLYLRNERAMEVKRHQMQMLLYGYSTTYGTSLYAPTAFDPAWNRGYWGWGGFGGYYPSSLGTTTHGLQFGIGDEGALKRELIQGLVAPVVEKKP